MKDTTITEALAERKVIAKRIDNKRQAIYRYTVLSGGAKDPIREEGGSQAFIRDEMQAIGDLQARQVAILRAIQKANAETLIKIGDEERTVADWLIWRRDVAPGVQQFLQNIVQGIVRSRDDAAKRKGIVVPADAAATAKDQDIIVNINERQVVSQIEQIDMVLGSLDGQLSLKNATVIVSY
jgi:hypothetical protein